MRRASTCDATPAAEHGETAVQCGISCVQVGARGGAAPVHQRPHRRLPERRRPPCGRARRRQQVRPSSTAVHHMGLACILFFWAGNCVLVTVACAHSLHHLSATSPARNPAAAGVIDQYIIDCYMMRPSQVVAPAAGGPPVQLAQGGCVCQIISADALVRRHTAAHGQLRGQLHRAVCAVARAGGRHAAPQARAAAACGLRGPGRRDAWAAAATTWGLGV